MADDNLFEFLHAEIVAKLCENVENEGNLNTSVQKLERLGFVVGQKYIERCTKDIPRFKDELDTMKFICKDFWMQVYKKQIDNLRTNHHGVYNLHDYKFKFLQQLSSGNQYKDDAPKYLAFSCGLVRGALSNLGYNCLVTAEVVKMPSCKFFIHIQHT